MKLTTSLKFFLLANIIATNFVTLEPAFASIFEEKSVGQDNVVAVAVPYRHGHNLVVIQQIEGKDKCWKELGHSPVVVDPLLMNFDFTGHCYRATDTNGYSIRIAGEEYGTDYLLKIVEENGELHLIATSRDPQISPLRIGKTNGQSNGNATKITLNSGWRLTKRSYQGKELSHFYFSGDSLSLVNGNLSSEQHSGNY